MPELPEVETTVRGLARFLDGETITSVTVNRPDLRRPFPA
ncbi:MAG: DNA-formamidopyrimidine glycosylase, partial [Alphaproteobacteria bacterium]|nr:DNA-formamidopyrimidine glycosylase [Alphaproteobacteria bacterium]